MVHTEMYDFLILSLKISKVSIITLGIQKEIVCIQLLITSTMQNLRPVTR